MAKAKKAAKTATRDRGGEALKRAAKKTAPAPEAVESFQVQATEPDAGDNVIQFEKLGKVQRWEIPAAPYAKDKAGRAAFVGGFMARTHQWQGQEALVVPQRFNKGAKLQTAFEDGYNEAARQDLAHNKPASLVGR